jgi:hypothetical protein
MSTINSLPENAYYYSQYYECEYNQFCIVKGTKGNRPNIFMNKNGFGEFYSSNQCSAYEKIRLATKDEIKWLDACIAANKFIPKEEALKPQYEIGRWYKSTPEENNRGGEIYYGKFLDNKGGFKTSSSSLSGSIITKGIYIFNSGYIWHLMEDLSEIQDLLPEDHEDKIKPEPIISNFDTNYKINDWIYVVKNETPGCKLEVGKVYQINNVTESWVETELGDDGGQIYFGDIRKAYIDEIPVKVADNDFKIGDIVVVTERYLNCIPVGYVSELIQLDINSKIAKYKLNNKNGNNDNNGWCKNIRKANDNEIFQYKNTKIFKYRITDSVFNSSVSQGEGIMAQIERTHNSNTSTDYSALSNIQYGTPDLDLPKQPIISDIIEVKKIKTFTK